MGDRHQETDEGYYTRNGDVLEWHWKEPKEAEAKATAALGGSASVERATAAPKETKKRGPGRPKKKDS